MRRGREFWKGLVGEVQQGARLADVARRYGVQPRTLSWWRWKLRSEGSQVARFLPVVTREPAAAAAPRVVQLRISDVSIRVRTGTDVAPGTKIFLATEPVDLRRGHDGLAALVRGMFEMDPLAGHLFVFVGRRLDRIKVLFWDRGGFVLYYKRLARGRFRMPKIAADANRIVLDGTELAMLLGGFDIVGVRRTAAWTPRERRTKVAS